MFFVYSGYVSPGNYDTSEGPNFTIKTFRTREEVIKFRREFDEDLYDECDHVEFRVFEGIEKNMKPVEKVISYDFE